MATKNVTFRIQGESNLDSTFKGVSGQFQQLGQEVGRASQNANSSLGVFGKVGSALGGMATVAGGIVAANLFGKISEGLSAFVSTGLSAVDSAQRLETGLGALLSMNNMYERMTTTSTVAVGDWAKEQAKAAEASSDLAFKQKELTAEINTQNASIQEQRQRIMQMTDGLDKNQQVARLAEMEIALEGMQRELVKTGAEQNELSNIQQEYTTVTKTTFEQVMGLADAQKLAAAQSKDLLYFVEKLAITSPFESDQVAIVTKLAIAAGLGTEQTKAFTAGFLDMAAAVGIGSESLDFAADQLLQVAKVGKITSVDLRQLRRLGIDLEKIIGTQMGMSIEEFNEKAAKSPEIFNELFDSVTKFSQNTFAGTAEKMATSLSGLKSTFSDIFKVGAKNMLRPLVEAVGPMASDMLGRLSSFVTGPEMAKIGESIPKILFGAFESLSGGEEGGLFSGLKGLGLSSSLSKEIVEVTGTIGDFVTRIREAFGAGGIQGVFNEFGSMLSSFWTDTIQPELLRWRDEFFSWVKDLYPQIPGLLTDLVDQISAFIRDNWPTIQTELSAWATKFWEWTNTAIAGAGAALTALLAALTAWATSPEAQTSLNTMGQELGRAIYQGVAFLMENHEEAARVLGGLIVGLGAAVAVIAADLIMIGGQIVAGMLSGMLEEMGVNVQPALISELQSILQGMAENGMTIIREVARKIAKALGDGLREALKSDVGKALAETVTLIKDELGEAITYLTDDLLPLMVKGFEYVTEGVKNFISSIKEAANELASMAIPDWLEMHSPPPLATALDMVADSAGLATKSINSLMTGMTAQDSAFKSRFIDDLNMGGFLNAAGAGQGGIRRNFRNIIKNAISDNMHVLEAGGDSGTILSIIQQQAARFNFPPSFAAEFAQAEGYIEHLVGTFKGMWSTMRIENLSQNVGLASQFAGIAQSFADMVETSGSSRDGRIGELQDFLAGTNEVLTKTQDVLVDIGSGVMENITTTMTWDRVNAQAELNQLLEEQRLEQEKILALEKSQKDLAFLQQQISLLEMIQSRGLNPADILGGIELGLGASANDLLTATSNVVQAMVEQINSDLQISSPSKVMAKIGQQVGAGLARGVEMSRSVVQGAIAKMPMLGGDNRNYSKTNNMPVVINNYGGQSKQIVNDIMILRGRTNSI